MNDARRNVMYGGIASGGGEEICLLCHLVRGGTLWTRAYELCGLQKGFKGEMSVRERCAWRQAETYGGENYEREKPIPSRQGPIMFWLGSQADSPCGC